MTTLPKDATSALENFIRELLIQQIKESDLRNALILRNNFQYTALLALTVHQFYNPKAQKIIDTYPLITQIISNDKNKDGLTWFQSKIYVPEVKMRHDLGRDLAIEIVEQSLDSSVLLLDLGGAFGVQWDGFEKYPNMKVVSVDLGGITDLAKAISAHIFPDLIDFISFENLDLTKLETPAAITNLCLVDLEKRNPATTHKIIIYAQGLVRYIGIEPIVRVLALLCNLKNTDIHLILTDNEFQLENKNHEARVVDNEAVKNAGGADQMLPKDFIDLEQKFKANIPKVVFQVHNTILNKKVDDEIFHITYKE
jgi:hypothetical protein